MSDDGFSKLIERENIEKIKACERDKRNYLKMLYQRARCKEIREDFDFRRHDMDVKFKYKLGQEVWTVDERGVQSAFIETCVLSEERLDENGDPMRLHQIDREFWAVPESELYESLDDAVAAYKALYVVPKGGKKND